MELKNVRLSGPMRSESEIAYVMDGKKVFFSCLTPSRTAPSSINAAERIVLAIAGAERVDWQLFTFFDVQTHRGFPSRRVGTYSVDRLRIKSINGQPQIQHWVPTAQSAMPRILDTCALRHTTPADMERFRALGKQEAKSMPGIPEHILALFRPYINE